MFERPLYSVGILGPFAIAFFGACVPSLNGKEAREPNVNTPSSFGGMESAQSTSAAQQKFTEFFASNDLRALIDTAIKNNQELNAQFQEIVIAKNEARAAQAEYLPKLRAGANAGVERASENTAQGRTERMLGLPENLGNFTFGLSGSWEVDIWGKLRNSAKAARVRYLATLEARHFMITQLVAELSRSYYDLVALDSQTEILNRNIAVQTDALEVIRLEKQAGKVTELAVRRFEAEVLKNRSRIYDLEQQKVQAENRINFLAGRFPQPVARNAQDFAAALPSDIQTGLPSELLKNRPDVRQAELELLASKLDVNTAQAAFYPSLSIDAQVGYRSFNGKHLVDTPESLLYGAAAGLSAPLLNRAGIAAQYASANAKQMSAVIGYEKTILQAFTDVVNQLAAIQNLQKGYDLQVQQVDALARAVEVSGVLFQSARADYMEVLLTRRDSLDAQMELAETKKRRFQAMVNVYQALGGGWRAGAIANR